MADALAHGGDEGRDKLRQAAVRSKYPLTRGFPNGTTRQHEVLSSLHLVMRLTEGTETS